MARRRQKKQRSRQSRSRGSLPLSNRGLPKNLQKINLNAAGVDVGIRRRCVAVLQDRDEVCVQTFGTITADLAALADWLQTCGVTTVAMESTGGDWVPVFEMLEERGFEVKLGSNAGDILPSREIIGFASCYRRCLSCAMTAR